MAGICARLGTLPAEHVLIERMTQKLASRGTSGLAIWIQGAVGLGLAGPKPASHTEAVGPLNTPSGNCWIVFDGHLTNRRELRQQLQALGHHFRTDCDAEVVLRLYECQGRSAVQQLQGAFAFVIWDGRTRRLLAARDHLGQKPLYYARRNGELLIASEIKGLLAADPELRKVDAAALDEYLALGWVSSPRTFFRDVRKLPPAHTLTYDPAQGLTTQRYWQFDYEPKLPGRDEDLIDEWEQRLVVALRAQVAGGAPVAALLNGGLDAALVVSLLRQHRLVDDLPTLCLGVPYGECDEAPGARLVAQRHGTPHHERYVRPSVLEHLPRLVATLDEPPVPAALWAHLLAQLAGEHTSVVLTGLGGPELFAGHQRYLDHLDAQRYARLPAKLRRTVGASLELVSVASGGAAGRRLRALTRLAAEGGGEGYLRTFDAACFSPQVRHGLYGASVREQSGDFVAGAVTAKAYEHAPTTNLLERMLYSDLQSHLPDDQLMRQQQLMAAQGVETRNPFLDHALIEFVARLPVRLKCRDRTLRSAQLQLVQRHLPPGLLERTPRNLPKALPGLLRGELDQVHAHCLWDMQLARDGFLVPGAVTQVLHEHRAGRIDHGDRLWLLSTLEIWYRLCIRGQSQEELEDQFIERTPAAPAAA